MGFYRRNYDHVLSCMFLALIPINGMASSGLSSTFYSTTCPKALSTIRGAVNTAVAKEHRMGASLLRLHFHDCFVNASSLSLLFHYNFFSFLVLFGILFMHIPELFFFYIFHS